MALQKKTEFQGLVGYNQSRSMKDSCFDCYYTQMAAFGDVAVIRTIFNLLSAEQI